MQEVKAADKIKVLAVIDLSDSNNEAEETEIPSKTSNVNVKPVTNALTNISTDLEPYLCKICKKSFKKIDSIRQHKRDKHQHEILAFKCEHCPFSSGSEMSLIEHRRTVHRDKVLKCQICNKFFLIERSLEQHMRDKHF